MGNEQSRSRVPNVSKSRQGQGSSLDLQNSRQETTDSLFFDQIEGSDTFECISYEKGNVDDLTSRLDNIDIIDLDDVSGNDKIAEPSEVKSQGKPPCRSLKVYTSSELTNEEIIGEGGFGRVLKGKLHGTPIAIKIFHAPLPVDEIQGQLSTLTGLKHRNVVTILGVLCSDKIACPQVVLQYFPDGNLLQFFKTKENPQDYAMLQKLSHDIIVGCEYLHSKNVVHGNLAARNILIEKAVSKHRTHYNAKVSDYGIIRFTNGTGANYVQVPNGKIVPIRWAPKELLDGQDFTYESDFWGFGVVLWEMWSKGDLPFGAACSNMEVLQFLKSGSSPLKVRRPKGCPKHIVDVMESLFKVNPKERPTFSMLCSRFEEIRNYKKEKQAGDLAKGNQVNQPPVPDCDPIKSADKPANSGTPASKHKKKNAAANRPIPQVGGEAAVDNDDTNNKNGQNKDENAVKPPKGQKKPVKEPVTNQAPPQMQAGEQKQNKKQKNQEKESNPSVQQQQQKPKVAPSKKQQQNPAAGKTNFKGTSGPRQPVANPNASLMGPPRPRQPVANPNASLMGPPMAPMFPVMSPNSPIMYGQPDMFMPPMPPPPYSPMPLPFPNHSHQVGGQQTVGPSGGYGRRGHNSHPNAQQQRVGINEDDDYEEKIKQHKEQIELLKTKKINQELLKKCNELTALTQQAAELALNSGGATAAIPHVDNVGSGHRSRENRGQPYKNRGQARTRSRSRGRGVNVPYTMPFGSQDSQF